MSLCRWAVNIYIKGRTCMKWHAFASWFLVEGMMIGMPPVTHTWCWLTTNGLFSIIHHCVNNTCFRWITTIKILNIYSSTGNPDHEKGMRWHENHSWDIYIYIHSMNHASFPAMFVFPRVNIMDHSPLSTKYFPADYWTVVGDSSITPASSLSMHHDSASPTIHWYSNELLLYTIIWLVTILYWYIVGYSTIIMVHWYEIM